jgi:5-methylcytosine-specific restriction enzyme A
MSSRGGGEHGDQEPTPAAGESDQDVAQRTAGAGAQAAGKVVVLRLCIDCGRASAEVRRGRCPDCRRTYERNKSRTRRRTAAERRRRQALIAAHVQAHGWVCPGYDCEPHASDDLTADHLEPQALRGRPEGEIRVLCRSCNSKRGAREAGGVF